MAREDQSITICEGIRPITLKFSELLEFHQGDATWGCAVGFRAMQVAAQKLYLRSIWSRDHLSLISAHPGPGVRDAIEFVTKAISLNQFKLTTAAKSPGKCTPGMEFSWWISDGIRALYIQLDDSFPIHELDQALSIDQSDPNAALRLEEARHSLTEKLWETPLDQLFITQLLPCEPRTSQPHIGASQL